MTTIDKQGLNAVVPTQVGTPLRIRVLFMAGKANGKGIWLTITRDEEFSTETLEPNKNLWLLENVCCYTAKTTKSLDTWARKIYVHARRIASYFENGNTEYIKRLVNTI